jgi:WD40 repeat protein
MLRWYEEAPAPAPEAIKLAGVKGITISPNGKLFAITGRDHFVGLWDVESQKLSRQLQGRADEMAFSLDGKRLACGSGNSMSVWDVETGQQLALLKGRADVRAVANGRAALPWCALAHRTETVISQSATEEPAAWFPVALEPLIGHPVRPRFTGAAVNQLYFLSLGGEDAPPLETWFYSLNQRDVTGPVTPAELIELAETGEIPKDAFVSRDRQKWYAARKIRGIRWPDS